MLSKPKVSIVLPTSNLNQAELALKSLFNQDYPNKEIIVINDNPKLEISPNINRLIEENNVILINNPQNQGIAKSLNSGIKTSKSEFILIYCDDYYTKEKQWIRHSVEKLSGGVDHLICSIETEDAIWKEYQFLLRLITFRLIVKKSFGGGVSYKREVFRKVGLFDWKTFRFAGEDGDMKYRMGKKGYKIGYLDDSIIHYHFHEKNSISKSIKKEYYYGLGHGARRKKYGKRLGIFDFDIRLFFFLSFLSGFFGLFINYWVSLLFLLPFFFGALKQSFNPYSKTKWLPGLLFYPFVGVFIFLVQTIGAVEGYLTTKRDKYNKNVEYLEDG